MSSNLSRMEPLKSAASILAVSFLFGGMLALITSPVLTLANPGTGRQFAGAALVGLALAIAHNWIESEDTEGESDSIILTIFIGLISVFLYNGIILISIVAAATVLSITGAMSAGVVTAVLWPGWEVASIKRGLPLSFSGILLWLIALIYALLYLPIHAGKAISEVVSDISWEEWIYRISEFGDQIQREPLEIISNRGLQRPR